LEIGGLWSPFFPKNEMAKVKTFIAYSPFLRSLSRKLVTKALGSEFYAIHGRLGDLAKAWEGATSLKVFVRTKQFGHWNKSLPCYLASDQPDAPFFRELKNHIKVVTYKDLNIQEYINLFPQERSMRMDMVGVLDKLICAQAKDFIGSFFSTFSAEIEYIRTHSKYVFPEKYEWRHHPTNNG